jgi:hypothetical protein
MTSLWHSARNFFARLALRAFGVSLLGAFRSLVRAPRLGRRRRRIIRPRGHWRENHSGERDRRSEADHSEFLRHDRGTFLTVGRSWPGTRERRARHGACRALKAGARVIECLLCLRRRLRRLRRLRRVPLYLRRRRRRVIRPRGHWRENHWGKRDRRSEADRSEFVQHGRGSSSRF